MLQYMKIQSKQIQPRRETILTIYAVKKDTTKNSYKWKKYVRLEILFPLVARNLISKNF